MRFSWLLSWCVASFERGNFEGDVRGFVPGVGFRLTGFSSRLLGYQRGS